MIFNSINVAASYPSEKIQINLNNLDISPDNARVGVRFRSAYYDTRDQKINFNNTAGYRLSSVQDDPDIESIYAVQPTNFFNPMDFNPFEWTVANPTEYIYVTFLGGVSALTVWPTHPYPRMTKVNNFLFSLQAGLVSALGFEGEMVPGKYHPWIKSNNFTSVNFTTPSLVLASDTYRYASASRKTFELGQNKNWIKTYNRKALGSFIIDNSFSIDVPVVTSKVVVDDAENQIFRLSFFDNTNANGLNSVANKTTNSNLQCLSSEALSAMGIPYPYTTTAAYNNKTGAVSLVFKDLFVNKEDDATVSFETSAAIPAAFASRVSVAQQSTNNFTISTNTVPVYFWNYRFLTSTPSPRRDAFSVSFQTSSFVTSQAEQYVQVKTVMRDNFYQNIYDINLNEGVNSARMLKRFIETTDDYSLSAILMSNPSSASNAVYKNRQWSPAYADYRFINDGLGNRYNVRIQLSSFTGAIYEQEQPVEFLLNGKNIIFNLGLTESGETSATVSTVIFPTPDDGYNYRWGVFPPENVVIRNLEGDILIPGQPYPDFEAQFFNLGVDKTQITLYSEEYGASATTYWFPPSSVVNDMTLQIMGDVNDMNQTATATLSAFCNRRGFQYRVPEDASIIWNESANDPRGAITFHTYDKSQTIQEGTSYASINDYSLINASISSIPTPQYPNSILFNIACGLFRPDFSMNVSKLFVMREYPANQYLNIDATIGSQVIPSSVYTHKVLTSPGTINMKAIYPDLSVNINNLRWQSVQGTSITNGTGETFSLNFSAASACVTLSALNGKPFEGNFKEYNFTDSICFFNVSGMQPLNYIAFPENQYTPLKTAASTSSSFGNCNENIDTIFNIFTQSNGMSSFKPCHTENFYFSASPGFDRYVWQIGNIHTESNSNKIIVPVTFANVSANNNVSVSAFNHIFLDVDPVTIYNTASSDNSNKFRQSISFLDFPTPSATITVTNDYFDVNKYAEIPKMTCEIDTGYLDLKNYTMNIVLSSKDFVQVKEINQNRQIFNNLIKVGIEDADFIIKENSFNQAVLYVSGNIGVTIEGFDFCTEYKPVTSNFVYLTAYNGPNLELYAPENIASVGETVVFYNGSNTNFSSMPSAQFVQFTFDNGEGSIQTTNSSYISAVYNTEGPKSPSLTGLLLNGASAIQTWNDLIFIKDDFQPYDSSITREFYEKIELPYDLEEIKVKPNDWQYASTINASFKKLQTNMIFLSSICSVNNIQFPKAYGGYLGTKFGNFKWQTKYNDNNLGDNLFKDIKSAQWVGDKIVVANDNMVEIYDGSEHPALLFSTDRIGEGETLSNPVKIQYIDSLKRLYILDNAKQIMFVCEFDINNPSAIKLTHYWGGLGERLDRTKLNNPVDFCLDAANHLYIVDKDSYTIKVYNKNLNWIRNIVLPSWNFDNRPLSISSANDIFSVTDESGTTYIIDEFGNVQETIIVVGSTGSSLNAIHLGIIYILADNVIHKYTINNTYVSSSTYSSPILNVVYDQLHGYLVFQKHILKFVDFIEIDKIINDAETLSGFSWNSIFVNESEFVTDYVYNDSFKKIYDNITILNSRLTKKLFVDVNEYGDVTSQYTSAFAPSAISQEPVFIGTNEPVLYDTINRGIVILFNAVQELKTNTDIQFVYPNNNENIQWRWKYHYIDRIQKPTLEKNPISWRELKSSKIIGNTQLSGISSWCVTREGRGGNHSEICWNFQQTQCNSYFPLTWEDTQCGQECGHTFTWEELEKDCCKHPDFVFADCISAC